MIACFFPSHKNPTYPHSRFVSTDDDIFAAAAGWNLRARRKNKKDCKKEWKAGSLTSRERKRKRIKDKSANKPNHLLSYPTTYPRGKLLIYVSFIRVPLERFIVIDMWCSVVTWVGVGGLMTLIGGRRMGLKGCKKDELCVRWGRQKKPTGFIKKLN